MPKKLALLGGEKIRQKPFAPHPVIGSEERDEITEVLDSGQMSGFIAQPGTFFLGGPKVKKFEELFKTYFKVDHAISVNSATAGLHAACAALEIGPGDEVIVPPYTMSATSTSVVMTNGIPVFVDIEDSTFGLDPQKIEEKISDRTKAIIVVHLFGHPARIDEIIEIANKHNLRVIEDCAQSPGATYKGKFVGTFGDIGIFSLNQHKTITTGEGGMIITNDERLACKMQLVRNHGEAVVDSMDDLPNVIDLVGWNYRMTELEAAVGIGQFNQLDKLTDHRIELAEYLNKNLENIHDGIIIPETKADCKHVYFSYPIKFLEELTGFSRNSFVKAVVAEGLPMGAGYVSPLYLASMYQKQIAFGDKGCPFSCPYYGKEVNYNKGICPTTERLYEKEMVVSGICRYPLTKADMDDVINIIKKVLDNIDELKKWKNENK